MGKKAAKRSSRKRRAPRPPRQRVQSAQPRAALKRRLLATISGTDTQRWTVEDLLQAVDCSDRELLLQCCQELVRDGHMDEGWRLPPDRPAAEHLPGHMAFDLPPAPTPEQLKEREELQKVRARIGDAINAPQRLAAASHRELEKIGARLDNLLNTQQRATTVSHKELQKVREELNSALDAQQRATTVSHKELRKIREHLENFPNAPLPVTVTSSVPLELAPVKPVAELTEEQIDAMMGDISGLSDFLIGLRRYCIRTYREKWTKVQPSVAMKDAETNEAYQKEFGIVSHHISSWRRALGRKPAKNN